MKSDINGTSQCPAGEERIEYFWSSIARRKLVQYDYRDKSGSLFSTVGKTVSICRKRKDAWLENPKR